MFINWYNFFFLLQQLFVFCRGRQTQAHRTNNEVACPLVGWPEVQGLPAVLLNQWEFLNSRSTNLLFVTCKSMHLESIIPHNAKWYSMWTFLADWVTSKGFLPPSVCLSFSLLLSLLLSLPALSLLLLPWTVVVLFVPPVLACPVLASIALACLCSNVTVIAGSAPGPRWSVGFEG